MSGQDACAIGAPIRMRLPQLTPLELRVVDTPTPREDLTQETLIKQVARGDMFIGTLCHAIAQEADVEAALQQTNAAATRHISTPPKIT